MNIAFDPAGNLCIADQLNHRIRKVDAATGAIATVAATGSPGFGGDGGPATRATLLLTQPDARVAQRHRALSEAERAAMLRNVPLGRPGRPDEVALCALFLASDAASFVSTATLEVNGGR